YLGFESGSTRNDTRGPGLETADRAIARTGPEYRMSGYTHKKLTVINQPTQRTDARRFLYAVLAAGATALLVACGSTPVQPGHYRVERGDTLAKIARQHGQTISNLARWNKLSTPNRIAAGQILRVTPPSGIA